MKLNENKKFYMFPMQRKVLVKLMELSDIENNFFLTGGTALSVFYLNHRQSNDIDLFTTAKVDLSDIGFELQRIWLNETITLKENANFLSLLIRNIKVDFVIDLLSIKENRQKYYFKNKHYVSVDTITNIASNKLCAVVSRREIKDYLDLYFISKYFSDCNFETIYKNAKHKDAIFDDPATVAFQMEEGINFTKDNKKLFPEIFIKFNAGDFYAFYARFAKFLYHKLL